MKCAVTENRNETSDMLFERVKLSAWVQKALDHANMTQAELSRALIQAGLPTIDRSAVNKIVLGARKLSGDELLEVSRTTGYPIPDQRIGRSNHDEQSSGHIIESRQEHKKVSAAQRESWLRALIARVLEFQGMNSVTADNLAAAIARVADMPPDLRDGALDEGQIQGAARVLAALFDPKHPL
jgi:hypothetical protein